MLNNPPVSVIVPIYNVERFISRCVQSLMNQTLQNIEYIFVDDCTPDNSIVILNNMLASYPNKNVKILRHTQNLGLAAARLTGLKAATGHYIVHCDSDDWVEANAYNMLYKTALNYDADVVIGGCYIESEEDSSVVYIDGNCDDHNNILNPCKFGGVYGAVWNKLIRHSLYVTHNIYPIEGLNMWEDSTMTMRLRWYSRKTVVLHEPLYHYWVGQRQSVFFSEVNLCKVDEMVNAVHFFEDFFTQEGVLQEAAPLLRRLKLMCKERLMAYPTREGFAKWRSVFPDNDMSAWGVSDYSMATKLKITLCHFLPERLAWLVFKNRRHHA